MGGDGGTKSIQRAFFPATREYLDKEAQGASKTERAHQQWNYCRLSTKRLTPPIVACELGYLFNKEVIMEQLLLKTMPVEFAHIRKLKDVLEVHFTPNPARKGGDDDTQARDGEVPRFVCPIAQVDVTGLYRFNAVRCCGAVFSERGLKQISSGGTAEQCFNCGKTYDPRTDVVVLNGTEDEVDAARTALYRRRAAEKERKKQKKGQKSKEKAKQAESLGAGSSVQPAKAMEMPSDSTSRTTAPGPPSAGSESRERHRKHKHRDDESGRGRGKEEAVDEPSERPHKHRKTDRHAAPPSRPRPPEAEASSAHAHRPAASAPAVGMAADPHRAKYASAAGSGGRVHGSGTTSTTTTTTTSTTSTAGTDPAASHRHGHHHSTHGDGHRHSRVHDPAHDRRAQEISAKLKAIRAQTGRAGEGEGGGEGEDAGGGGSRHERPRSSRRAEAEAEHRRQEAFLQESQHKSAVLSTMFCKADTAIYKVKDILTGRDQATPYNRLMR